MGKISLSSIALTALMVGPTLAADMPVKAAPPPPPPVYRWTGCYIGGNIGWAQVDTRVSFDGVRDFSRSANGFAGGGQFGCDYQFASNWVIGIQGLIDGTSIDASRESVLFPGNTFHAKVDWFGTITGRLGYTITPSFLLYGKFGWGSYKSSLTMKDTVTGVELGSAS